MLEVLSLGVKYTFFAHFLISLLSFVNNKNINNDACSDTSRVNTSYVNL